MTYTKGPLKITGPSPGTGPGDDGGDYAIYESGVIIGEAIHRADENEYRNAEANARLWAAAPDLLAALVELVAVPNKHRPDRVWNEARVAIAKATGGKS